MDWKELKKELIEAKGYVEPESEETRKIETNMLQKIDMLLRLGKDKKEDNENVNKVFNQKKVAENEEEIEDIDENEKNFITEEKNNILLNNKRKEQLKDIEKLQKAMVNYKNSEFIIYIMSNAHDKYVVENINKYDLSSSDDAYKFVPFNLLKWDYIEKTYYSVLAPILDSINIKYDKNEIQTQFKRDQLTFLLGNGISSKETLKEEMQDIKHFYPEMIIDIDENGKKITDILCDEKNIKNISDKVAENIDLNVVDMLKQMFLKDKNEIGILHVEDLEYRRGVYKFADNLGQRKIGLKKRAYPKPNKPISKILYELSKEAGVIFASNIKKNDYKYTDSSLSMHRKVDFIPYEQCSPDLKKQIDKRNKKVKKFVEKVEKGNNRKSNESGLITLVCIKKEYNRKGHLVESAKNGQIIQIPMSLKELAQFGILPREIGWEPNNRSLIHSKKSHLILPASELENNSDISKDNANDDFRSRLKYDGIETKLSTMEPKKELGEKEKDEK